MTTITASPFGSLPDGRTVTCYTLVNRNGCEVRILDFGGVIVSVKMPDRNGVMADVVLGFDSLDGYLENRCYLGCAVGRCAGRIARGQFTLGGKSYSLARNDGQNHLHGGIKGFHLALWDGNISEDAGGSTLKLHYVSASGEEGYPGTLDITLCYSLTDDDTLSISYEAFSDEETLCNITNHTYFNLAGENAGDILDHELTLESDDYAESDAESIPTGRLIPVKDTPMDFSVPHVVGERIGENYPALQYGGGYDHVWFLRDAPQGELRPCATLYHKASGRKMTCRTDSPCVVFYSGNYLDGTLTGKGKKPYVKRAGLCLETQWPADAVNHPHWPSIILRSGEIWRSRTDYHFSAE